MRYRLSTCVIISFNMCLFFFFTVHLSDIKIKSSKCCQLSYFLFSFITLNHSYDLRSIDSLEESYFMLNFALTQLSEKCYVSKEHYVKFDSSILNI